MDPILLITLGSFVFFMIAVFNPFLILLIFAAGSYFEPMQFFPQLVQYYPTTTLGLMVFIGLFFHRIRVRQFSGLRVNISQIKLMWLFVVWMFISSLVHHQVSMPIFFNVIRVFIPYFLFVYIVRTRRQISTIMWVFLILGAIAAVYGIYQFKFNISNCFP